MKMSDGMRLWMIERGIKIEPEVVTTKEMKRMLREKEGEFFDEGKLPYNAPYRPKYKPQVWGLLNDGRLICTEASGG